jgi:hypothetical protein
MTVHSFTNGMKRLVIVPLPSAPGVGGVGVAIQVSFVPRLIRAVRIPSRVHKVLKYSRLYFLWGTGGGRVFDAGFRLSGCNLAVC